MDDDRVTIEFEGTLVIERSELDEAEGDAGQAVQNAIGHTGVEVDHAEVNDHKGPSS